MKIVAAIGLAQWLLAYLTLDFTFRRIPVDPDRLPPQARIWRRRYTVTGLAACLAGGTLQTAIGGLPGAAVALLGPLPWWLLWRFGWRKQFTFLYLHDGGSDVVPDSPER